MARLRALGAALVSIAVLSAVLGCEDEPEPDIADPTQSATAPSPTETESSPTTSRTPEALTPEETVRAWVDAQNRALASGDTAGLAALAATDCSDCEEFIESIDKVYLAGGHFEGGDWTLVRGDLEQTTPESAVFTCGIRIAGGTIVEAQDAEPESYPADSLLFKFGLERHAGAWQVSTIKVVK